jgi:hypothetical protein
LLSDEQFARVRDPVFSPVFKLELDTDVNNAQESFMWSFYQNLFVKTEKRLWADIPIIDFNFTRLNRCIEKVAVQRDQPQTMLSIDELVVALEFYLQIDGRFMFTGRSSANAFPLFLVDMFYLKTCAFNGAQPRLLGRRFREGIFCVDPPEPRFAITACGRQHCLCCHSPCPRRFANPPDRWAPIPFTTPHVHRFVNQYEALLNCPAVRLPIALDMFISRLARPVKPNSASMFSPVAVNNSISSAYPNRSGRKPWRVCFE